MDAPSRIVRSILDCRPARDVRAAVIAYLSATRPASLKALCHPLGFADLPLFEDDEVAIKLHVWHPRLDRRQVPQPVCHSHGWPLRSTVLCGELRNLVFPLRPRSDGAHRLYRVAHAWPFSISTASDTCVDIGLPATTLMTAGTTYGVAAGAFHSTILAGGALVVTAVAADLRVRSGGVLALGRDEGARLLYERRPYTTSERELLRDHVVDSLLRESTSAGY